MARLHPYIFIALNAIPIPGWPSPTCIPVNAGTIYDGAIDMQPDGEACFEINFKATPRQINYIAQYPRSSSIILDISSSGGSKNIELDADEHDIATASLTPDSNKSILTLRPRQTGIPAGLRFHVSINAGALDGIGVVHISTEDGKKP